MMSAKPPEEEQQMKTAAAVESVDVEENHGGLLFDLSCSPALYSLQSKIC